MSIKGDAWKTRISNQAYRDGWNHMFKKDESTHICTNDTNQKICKDCNGTGKSHYAKPITAELHDCKTCNGKGKVKE